MLPFAILAILMPTAIVAQVSRFNAYVGCTTDVPGMGIPGTSTTIVATSQAACQTGCAATSQYSYYRVAGSTCLCSDTSPPSYSIVAAAGGRSTCANAAFAVSRLATTFSFLDCGIVQGASGLGPVFTTVRTNECFDSCRFANGVFISATGTDPSASEFQCRCRTGGLSYSGRTCGPGPDGFYLYTHTQTAASAGLARRGAKMRNVGTEPDCPAGLTACRIQDSEDGYECIDTMSELESCGGCVFGQYGTRKTSARGVNCASLDGRDFGSVTCKSGRCVDAF